MGNCKKQSYATINEVPNLQDIKIFSALVDLPRDILIAEGIEEISLTILNHAKNLTNSRFGFVGYIDPLTNYLVSPTLTTEIWDNCKIKDKNYIFKEFKGLWGWVLLNKQPLLTNNPSSDPRSTGIPEGHIIIENFLSVPAMIKDELVGQISLANSSRDYNEQDIVTLQQIASLYAIAINRKRAEEKLVQSLEALQAVYNIATTLRGSYEMLCEQVVFNLAKFLKIACVSVQHIKEDKITIVSKICDGILSHNEIESLSESPCSEAIEARKPLQFIMKDQGKFPLYKKFKSCMLAPILIEGETKGFICAMDYSDRKFNEDELRLLEIFSKHISYELERIEMEKKLRHLDKMKLLGQLAAGVAHEVRNPLNAILAIAEALFQDIKDIGENPDYYKPFLNHIRSQVDRLSNLMSDLLDLGKPIKQETFQKEYLPEICLATIDLWKQMPISRDYKIIFIQPEEKEKLYLMADSSRLQQVFLNVLENACHHSPRGSDIQFVILNPKGGFIKIHIIDQGTGVPSENLSKVFEPFFTSRKKGTGLGLSLVKHIVQSHGGEVTIWNNTPPPGCTIEITLPLFKGEE
ncbi:MAG: GAF domain-containing protein [Nitrospirae bacterium]|jgi:signal transduction histidine kinase|nr:GAF domain-containing protein [Nitrospirota bacterium]